MTLVIELPPELERRLETAAAREGKAPQEFVRAAVEEKLAASMPEPLDLYAGLPRHDPAEIIAMAQAQGVGPLDFDELMKANFWPEDESIDEFLATLRRWRREEWIGPRHRDVSAVSTRPMAVADTDVVSLAYKGDTRAWPYGPHLSGHYVILSFMTVAELRQWAVGRAWGPQRVADLEGYIARFGLCHSSDDLCRWWAVAMVGARQRGCRIEVADAWVAATALMYDVPLITHNPGDYAGVSGLRILTEPAAGA